MSDRPDWTDVPRPIVTTRPLDVSDGSHLTEYLYDDGENDAVLVCAGHGGRVEPGTASQAIELAARLPRASCWARLGYDGVDDTEADADGEAFERYHPASTAIGPDDHPLLDAIADRGFETVISLHGLADEAVLVGGGVAAETKRRVARRLDGVLAHDVEIATESAYAGVSPRNFVNWLAEDGGLQLEQGPDVRSDPTGAVVDVLEALVRDDAL